MSYVVTRKSWTMTGVPAPATKLLAAMNSIDSPTCPPVAVTSSNGDRNLAAFPLFVLSVSSSSVTVALARPVTRTTASNWVRPVPCSTAVSVRMS